MLELIEFIKSVGFPIVAAIAIWKLLDRSANKLLDASLHNSDKQADSMSRLADSHEKTADSLEKLTDIVSVKMDPSGDPKYRHHVFSAHKTEQALLRYADAFQAKADALGCGDTVRPHVAAMKHELTTQH